MLFRSVGGETPNLVDAGNGSTTLAALTTATTTAQSITPVTVGASSLTGIDFLLMMVPAIAVALTLADPGSTVGIQGEHLARLDAATKDPQLRNYFWLNRKNAPASQAAVLIAVTATCQPPSLPQMEAWLGGTEGPLAAITPRGLITGLKKCRGLQALALAPARQFRLVLVLPS